MQTRSMEALLNRVVAADKSVESEAESKPQTDGVFVFRLPDGIKAEPIDDAPPNDAEVWRLPVLNLPETRPTKRSQCIDGPRPCPWVTCRYNLYLDVTRRGSVQFSKGEVDIEEIPPEHSCALDVADKGAISLERIAAILGLTRERVRQVALEGLARVRQSVALQDYARDDGWDVTHEIDWAEVTEEEGEEGSPDAPLTAETS